MGSDDPAERALLQGLIKVAAAYVHDVRGNPPGIARNLEGARALLAEARDAAWRAPAGLGLDVDLDALIADDRRAAWPTWPPIPTDPTLGPPTLRRSHPMTMPAPIPTIDVTEAERRLREDPARPVLSTSASRSSSPRSAPRARSSSRRPRSLARVADLPADRPLLRGLPPRRPVRGRGRLPHPGRAHRRRQRGGRHGRLGACRAAGPSRTGRGRARASSPADV